MTFYEKTSNTNESTKDTIHTNLVHQRDQQNTALGKLLTVIKPSDPVFDTKNIIYSIPCECGCEYKHESCRSLQVCVDGCSER